MVKNISSTPARGAEVLVTFCADLQPNEKALIVVDQSTLEVGDYLYQVARKITPNVVVMETPVAHHHGEEPSVAVADYMQFCNVVFGVTRYSLAHTQARRRLTSNGGRYLSLADYNMEQLSSRALQVDFLKWANVGAKLKRILDVGSCARITTPKGTDITVFFEGRVANNCPGFCHIAGTLGSPPDIETNISPLETKSAGIIIVDGSIPCEEIGVLKSDLRLDVSAGVITHIDTSIEDGRRLDSIFARHSSKARVLAEFGIGLNPLATLCGRMLEDEGCLGTIHFGFGSNSTVGGVNEVDFHLDFVIKQPTVTVDGIEIIRAGLLNIG